MHANLLPIACLLLAQVTAEQDFSTPPQPTALTPLRVAPEPAPLRISDSRLSPTTPVTPAVAEENSLLTDEPTQADTDYPVVPAAGYESGDRAAAPPRGPASSRLSAPQPAANAAQLALRQALAPAGQDALPGQPMSLLDALDGAGDPRQQRTLVQAYWRLAVAVAAYNYAVEEWHFLGRLPSPRSTVEQALLKARLAEADAHRQETKVAAVQRQYELADVTVTGAVDALPLPVDSPYVGPYRTRIGTLFAGRAVPVRLQRIDRGLPDMLAMVNTRALAVAAGSEAVDAILRAYQDGQSSLSSVLQIHDQLRQQRRAFLVAVESYNQQIAQYALAIVAPGMSHETIVATLIPNAARTRSPLVAGRGVRSAAADLPLDPIPTTASPGTRRLRVGPWR